MDDVDLASLEPLAGGSSGLTFAARVGDQRSVVRIVPPGLDPSRGDHPHEVDAALLRLVRGLLPVPEVLDVRRGDAASGTPGLLVTQWLPGERGDLVLPRLDPAGLTRLGVEVGVLLARLGGVPQPAEGPFVDAALTVGRLDGRDDLEREVAHWTDDERAGLGEVVPHAERVLGRVERVCLVHGDLDPANWLVDPDTLVVTGLVDWERARAGHPYADLGRVLRSDRRPAWVEAVIGTHLDRLGLPVGLTHDGAVELARAADVISLLDLVVGRGVDLAGDRADRLLRRIAATRDLHAPEPPG